MKKSIWLLSGLFVLFTANIIYANERYALVIGESQYKIPSYYLPNPVNDASDMKKTLEGMGFKVDYLPNATLAQIEAATMRLKNNLSRSADAYGFFFYSGHGVQSGGENYLIPSDAELKDESELESKAFKVQTMLSLLEEAKNELNIIVLDACRDNPLPKKRALGQARGLSVVSNQPGGSIIVYATKANETASDGTGRNGLFTSQLLKNLNAKIEVQEVFHRTGADVLAVSGGVQNPAVYNQYFGKAYLNGNDGNNAAYPPSVAPPPAASHSANTEKTFSQDELGGVWSGTVEYASGGVKYRDKYTIAFYDDGTCTVTIKAQDGGTQSGDGFWSAEAGVFNLDCDFYDAAIARLKTIKWVSMYALQNNNRRLRINIKPAPDYSGVVGITLNKGTK